MSTHFELFEYDVLLMYIYIYIVIYMQLYAFVIFKMTVNAIELLSLS